MTFAQFFKQKRLALRITLRGFCEWHNLDPGNISKLERGRVSAPQKQETLGKYAECLELNEADKREFMTLAAISAGRIPKPLTDEEFAAKLPLLLDIGQADIEDIKQFAEWLRGKI